jgi:hypothetical protein
MAAAGAPGTGRQLRPAERSAVTRTDREIPIRSTCFSFGMVGLKSAADRKSPGFPIPVFGGPHADIPLHDAGRASLANSLFHSARPRFSTWPKCGRRNSPPGRQSPEREPLWLVLEEVLGEVDRIARRGRAFGFRLTSITQRPAKLNKDVLTQLSTLIAMGVTSPQDRDARPPVRLFVTGRNTGAAT